MNKFKNLSVFCLVIMMLSPVSGFSTELIIFGYNAKPPKDWTQDGKARGILVDMIRYAEKEMGRSLPVKLYPWKRAYNNALNGGGAIIGLSKTTQRLEIFDYSDPMFYDEVILVVKKGKEFPFKTMEDLKGKKIAYTRGVSYGEAFSQAEKSNVFKPQYANTTIQALHMLEANRVDAAISGPGKIGLLMTLKKGRETGVFQTIINQYAE
ncbi:MAG: transporter substrate-binding domain-containing protein [Bermanella sp.]